MKTQESFDFDLARNGPLFRYQKRFKLIRTDHDLGIGRRIGWAILATWAPIMAFALIQGQLFEHQDPLLRHFGVHTRCLIAIPLLIFAEGLAQVFVPLVVGEFVNSGLVSEAKLPEFRQVLEKARRLLDSGIAFGIIIAVAALGAVHSIAHLDDEHDTSWALEPGLGIAGLGLAGWWFILIVRPLFILLLANWIWRVACLFLFFRAVAKLDLELAPTHADKVGGLGFLEEAVVVFAPVVFALSAVLASNWAHNVLYHQLHVASLKPLVLVYLVLVLAVFLSPWLAFMPVLKRFRRQSRFAYGALATRHGQLVDRRWIKSEEVGGEEMLSAPELGPVADVSSLFEIVEGIRTVPLRKKAAARLLFAALLPLIPVFAIEMPLKDIVKQLLGALVL